MALYYDLPESLDVYHLILWLFEHTKYFSREYKFTLGQSMKWDSLALVRSIYRAKKAKDKVVHLEHFLDGFELLKMEIRLCVDLKILSIKKQAELATSATWKNTQANDHLSPRHSKRYYQNQEAAQCLPSISPPKSNAGPPSSPAQRGAP